MHVYIYIYFIGSGHMTFDKIIYFFLILYVSSIDAEETCDLFFIKREFQKFLADIKEFKAKVQQNNI